MMQHSWYAVYIHSCQMFSICLIALHILWWPHIQHGPYSFVSYPILFRITFNSSENFHLRCPESCSFAFVDVYVSLLYSQSIIQADLCLQSSFILKCFCKYSTHSLKFINFVDNNSTIFMCDVTSQILKVKTLFHRFILQNYFRWNRPFPQRAYCRPLRSPLISFHHPLLLLDQRKFVCRFKYYNLSVMLTSIQKYYTRTDNTGLRRCK